MDEETRTLRKIGECFKINKLANNKPEPYFILGEEMTLVITGRFTGKDALDLAELFGKCLMALLITFLQYLSFFLLKQSLT